MRVLQLISELRRPELRRKPKMAVFIDSCNDVQTPLIFKGDVKIALHFEKDWLERFISLIKEGAVHHPVLPTPGYARFQRVSKKNSGELRRRQPSQAWKAHRRQ